MKRGYPSAKMPRSQMKPPPPQTMRTKRATETNDSLPEGVAVQEESGQIVLGFPYATVSGNTLTMALILSRNEAFAVAEAILDAAQQLPEEK